MKTPRQTLLLAFNSPQAMQHFSAAEWSQLIAYARVLGVLARLGVHSQNTGVWAQLPERVQQHMQGERQFADYWQRLAFWEVMKLRRVLGAEQRTFTLLKGMAYHALKLPNSPGRFLADVDIMVPKAELDEVETQLLNNGWQRPELNAYDDQYYRRWMHEVPPLRHEMRQIDLDLHHNIIPPVSRYHIAADSLFDNAQTTDYSWVKTLSNTHLTLHCCAHLFVDSDLKYRFRDILDIHQLITHFSTEDATFWQQLLTDSEHLGLHRPLFYCLHFSRKFLGTKIPSTCYDPLKAQVPKLHLMIMNWCVGAIILPTSNTQPMPYRHILAQWLLYLRSHWLKMPPGMLAKHLITKAWINVKNGFQKN